jgi:hypothetical protein
MSHIDDNEVRRIAVDLAAKYGRDAIAFVISRAARAAEIGDDIAYAIWDNILHVAREVLGQGPGYFLERPDIDGSTVAP